MYRLPKRQDVNKGRATVEDLIILCLPVCLPVYNESDLTRLPPVDTSHCDVSAILAELFAFLGFFPIHFNFARQFGVALAKKWKGKFSPH